MPICAVCGEEAEYVTRCKMCGGKFCAECGRADEKLCIYCLEDDDDYNDDVFNDYENWHEKQRLVDRF